jgi:uncharacterized protein (DUF1778 family)
MISRTATELERLFERSAYQADDDLVFAHPVLGTPPDAPKLRKRFKATLERAGVRAVRFRSASCSVKRLRSMTNASDVHTLWVHGARLRLMTTATKTARRNLRVSPSDDELFRRAADQVGESVSEFLVESGRTRAEMILADRTEFALDTKAWKAFNDALDQPAEVKPAIVELMRRPRPE